MKSTAFFSTVAKAKVQTPAEVIEGFEAFERLNAN